MKKNENIVLLLPFYQGNITSVVRKLTALYPHLKIIVINDNPSNKISLQKPGILVVNNNRNIGLARAMLEGYKKALLLNASIIIKLDPDFEYPPEYVAEIISALQTGHDFALGGFKRRFSKVGLVDYLFNLIYSRLESHFTGCAMDQHSPGLQGYNRDVIDSTIKEFENVIKLLRIRWGADLLLIKLAKENGFESKYIEIIGKDGIEKREKKKIFQQAFAASKIMLFHPKKSEAVI
jgi:glycosyltransferase involved in cell wall biosynthesis